MNSVVGVIGLLWCGIGGGLLFTLDMTGRAGVVSPLGAGLRIAFSRSVVVLCVWRLRGIVTPSWEEE